MKKFLKKPIGKLVLSLVACLVCSLCAALVNVSGFAYSIKTVTVDIDELYAGDAGKTEFYGRKSLNDVNAKLTGNIYLPRGVDENNPRPCIVLTHGYLNSKEFEEAPAIEMARRGYVVFAFDQYDHGDSTWDTPAQFNFYVWSAYDAVQYMYSQPYVLKASNGDGMIAVSGHSMGGFSSELAVAWDELTTVTGAQSYRKIAACLAVGADFRYDDGYVSAYSAKAYDKTYKTFNTRSCGTLYGEYDEFFFGGDTDKAKGGTVYKKDYAKDSAGYGMLGYTSDNCSLAENDTWTKVDPSTNLVTEAATGYGERILMKVAGDHPYNTWSPEATSKMIDFYDHAFNYQMNSLRNMGSTSSYGLSTGGAQVWWLKEVFTCLGLFALVAFMINGSMIVVDLPFLKKAKTKPEDIPAVTPATPSRKWIAIIVSVMSIIFSTMLIVPFMNRDSEGLAILVTFVKVLFYASLLIGVGVIIGWLVYKSKTGEVDPKVKTILTRAGVGATTIAAVSLVIRWVATDGISFITNGSVYYNAPSINTIVYWAIGSGLVGLVFALINHFVISENRSIAHLGLKANWLQVLTSLCGAIVVTAAAWAVLAFSNCVIGVDYRVYTYAFNAINGVQFVSALRYMPLFFIFYLCAGISIANATAGKKGWKADLTAVLLEALPVCLFIIIQYGRLEASGTAAWVGFALNGILVQGLVLTLVFLAIIQRRTLEKTGNIWTGVFINTIWFTMITLASTTVYQLAA